MNTTSPIGPVCISVAVFPLVNAVAASPGKASAAAIFARSQDNLTRTFAVVLALIGNFIRHYSSVASNARS